MTDTIVWEVRWSSSRKLPYFFNHSTGKSEWVPPRDLSDAQIRQLPGASKYLTEEGSAIPSERGQATEPKPAAAEKQGPRKARASHILAKHFKSRRPSSWRQQTITRSNAEARDIIQGHIDRISALPEQKRAEAFAAIAKTESDCSSAKQGGDLGWFTEGQMQATFEDATFNTPPGQMSGIVETESGTHVIMRFG